MMTENIIDRFETAFGKVIIVSTDRKYKIGDKIRTKEGDFRIRQVIPSSRPTEPERISFVVD